MPDEQGAVNDISGGSPSPVVAIHDTSGDDLISTVDFSIPAQEEKAVDSSADSVKTEKGAADVAKDDVKPGEEKKQELKKDDFTEDRLSAHPRFKQLITEKNAQREQIARMEQQIKDLSSKPQEKEQPLPFEDLGAKTPEELIDMLDSDPLKVLKNYGEQIRYETRESLKTEFQKMLDERDAKRDEDSRMKSIEAEYNAYAKDNPDFNEMWDSGELKAFMDEHPGHNAMSAHMAMTQDKRIEAARQEAIKEAANKAAKNKELKKNAQVLGSGPSAGGHTVNQVPAELKDTKKYGGLAAVLAQRSLARTSRQGAS